MPATDQTPTAFQDSIALRARGLRFRGVGNPMVFLDELGIIPIVEFLYRGANIIDVAEELNLPISVIHKWIEANSYGPEIEEASVLSAEGYIHRGEKMLKEARNKFDLDKAKALLEHGRFMAGKKNKKMYGTLQDVGSGQASVTYQFNIGQMPTTSIEAVSVQDAIDVEFTDVKKVSLSIADEFGLDLGPMPDYLPHTKPKHPATQRHKIEAPEERVEKVEVPRGKDTW